MEKFPNYDLVLMETILSKIFHKLEDYHTNGSVNLILDSVVYFLLVEKNLPTSKLN
jgi:hypothetical protein